MIPNQSNGYQPYNTPLNQSQSDSYRLNNQSNFNPSNFNSQQQNGYNQSINFSQLDNNHFGRNKVDRSMYTSSIEPTSGNKNFSFGKLESMGRFVGNTEEQINDKFKLNNGMTQSLGQNRDMNFNQAQNDTSSKMHNSQGAEFDRFPAFNVPQKNSQQVRSSVQYNGDQSMISKPIQNQTIQNQNPIQTPQQKRRRQILAIKLQLEMINKKMENSNLIRKPSNQTNQKPLSSNQNQNNNFSKNITPLVNNFPTNNNYQPTTPVFQQQNNQQNNLSTGLTFSKNNQNTLGVEKIQRNRGLATQSMIVSNEPSTGFKFQSIFDKYDSLKKPTYQATYKEEKSSPLDQFVNKGSNFNFNKEKENNTYKAISGLNNVNTFNSGGTSNNLNFDLNSKFTTKDNNLQNNYSSGSNSTVQSLNIGSKNKIQLPKQGGGMFKKKKDNPYFQNMPVSPRNNIPISPRNNTPIEPQTFKKSKPINSEQNFVTNAMKSMNIQESIQFKRQDFAVGKKLGKGQFGQVMLVQHKKTGFLCGMKVMEKKQIRDQKYEGQIARQLSIQFYLAHRNIAPLYGYFQDEKNVYLLVQYCTGGQLLELLRKNRRMEEPECSKIIKQIIEGIDYIHRQLIIHRDIKPENILFNFGVAKICDYGWAVYKGHGMRKTASVGSPLYYSPQIVMGVQYDQKIDIWDIGMMTYECLLGKIPFRIYSQLDLNRIVQDEIKFPEYVDVTDEAKDFILKIMKKKPQERMEIRQMLRHPFITKYQDVKLPIEIMKDFKQALSN